MNTDDDYDLGDLFGSWRKHEKQKKQSNLTYSTNLLIEQGIEFESKNDGIHLTVKSTKGIIDYYPSTGLFIR